MEELAPAGAAACLFGGDGDGEEDVWCKSGCVGDDDGL